ncbi:hypothetical protein [Deinococcus ficus]|uniref:hypothetical protein n=1 Tax=Deinococcus ficus TaxID=317577 RepID=UPI000419869B|nr:hypothetical protein [Deinococcus ficus]
MVRIWYETTDGNPIWRASVRHDVTGQRLYFADPLRLVEFMNQNSAATPPQQ